MKHTPATPLPWCTMPISGGGKYMRGFDCTDVARVGLDINHSNRQIEDNARYIAHAANAYPRLVQAIKADLSAYLGDFPPNHSATALRDLLRDLGEL